MKNRVPPWLVQVVWFLASIYATGALWYYLSRDDHVGAGLSLLGAIVLPVVAIQLHRLNDRDVRFLTRREQLAGFIKEAEAILGRSATDPLPISEHNEWVSRVEKYLNLEMDASYAARFRNFSGMTF